MAKQKDEKSAPLSKLKSSVFARGRSMAGLAMGMGTQALKHQAMKVIKRGDTQAFTRLLTVQVELLAGQLGQLKGTLMKGGQMLSMYGEHFLPEEVNKTLKSLQFESPPMAWESVLPLLEAELGENLVNLEVNPIPLASASIGQVHLGTIKSTGEVLAIKIQYPGVEKAIESDLKLIKSLMSIIELLPQVSHLDLLFEEVQTMFLQEINYKLELLLTDRYREMIGPDSRYLIPKTYPQYSSSKVLSTGFIEGLPVDAPEVKALSQHRRNHLAQSMIELYFHELFEKGVVQTDPHLGNYRVQLAENEKDKLVLLDFGAVRIYEKSFVKKYFGLVSSALDLNSEGIIEAGYQLGFLQVDDKDSLKTYFTEFCLLMVEPFVDEPSPFRDSDGIYDWGATDLPKRITQKAGQLISSFSMRTPPKEVVFLDRKTTGVFIFASVLKAQLPGPELKTMILGLKP